VVESGAKKIKSAIELGHSDCGYGVNLGGGLKA
jgi:hypothetical protein